MVGRRVATKTERDRRFGAALMMRPRQESTGIRRCGTICNTSSSTACQRPERARAVSGRTPRSINLAWRVDEDYHAGRKTLENHHHSGGRSTDRTIDTSRQHVIEICQPPSICDRTHVALSPIGQKCSSAGRGRGSGVVFSIWPPPALLCCQAGSQAIRHQVRKRRATR